MDMPSYSHIGWCHQFFVLPSSRQLSNHPVNIEHLLSICFAPKFLKRSTVFDFERFFACLVYHTALDPHFDAFGRSQRRAFGNDGGGHLRVSSSQYLVEEGL